MIANVEHLLLQQPPVSDLMRCDKNLNLQTDAVELCAEQDRTHSSRIALTYMHRERETWQKCDILELTLWSRIERLMQSFMRSPEISWKKKKKKKKETAVHRLTMADLNCWYITQSRLSSQSTSNQCHRLSTAGLPTAALSEAGLGWLTDKTRRGVNFFEFFLPGQTPGKKKKKKKKEEEEEEKKKSGLSPQMSN